jgi:hypothetical protein
MPNIGLQLVFPLSTNTVMIEIYQEAIAYVNKNQISLQFFSAIRIRLMDAGCNAQNLALPIHSINYRSIFG